MVRRCGWRPVFASRTQSTVSVDFSMDDETVGAVLARCGVPRSPSGSRARSRLRLRRAGDPVAFAAAVGLEKLSPVCARFPLFEDLLVLARPAVIVVIKLASEHEHVHERGVKEELLNALQRAEPEHVAHQTRCVVSDPRTPALSP